MATISNHSQEELENQIKDQFSKLGSKLYSIDEVPYEVRHLCIGLNKKIVEYFDNTRLLQNQPKEYTSL